MLYTRLPVTCLRRLIHCSSRLWASNADVRKKAKAKEIALANDALLKSKLHAVEQRHPDIFEDVYKVIDLGYAPGNWTEYVKHRLSTLHLLDDQTFTTKCHILGFDLILATPPPSVSTLQGNVFSKLAHESIANHFKDVALHEFRQSDKSIRTEIDELALTMGKLSLDKLPEEVVEQSLQKRKDILQNLEHRVDLVLSDLCAPFRQMDGFYSLTQLRPHQRINSVPSLARPYKDPHNLTLDMADASLLLTCNMLKPGGSMVLRLGRVLVDDEEIDFVHEKLEMVFDEVHMTQTIEHSLDSSRRGEIMCVCKGKKKDGEFAIEDIF